MKHVAITPKGELFLEKKEDELIEKLIKNNEEKFNEVKNILLQEKNESGKIISDLNQKLEK